MHSHAYVNANGNVCQKGCEYVRTARVTMIRACRLLEVADLQSRVYGRDYETAPHDDAHSFCHVTEYVNARDCANDYANDCANGRPKGQSAVRDVCI